MGTHRYELVVILEGAELDEYMKGETPVTLQSALEPLARALHTCFRGMYVRAFIRQSTESAGSSTRGNGTPLN